MLVRSARALVVTQVPDRPRPGERTRTLTGQYCYTADELSMRLNSGLLKPKLVQMERYSLGEGVVQPVLVAFSHEHDVVH